MQLGCKSASISKSTLSKTADDSRYIEKTGKGDFDLRDVQNIIGLGSTEETPD